MVKSAIFRNQMTKILRMMREQDNHHVKISKHGDPYFVVVSPEWFEKATECVKYCVDNHIGEPDVITFGD